jgi:hypothetical protein
MCNTGCSTDEDLRVRFVRELGYGADITIERGEDGCETEPKSTKNGGPMHGPPLTTRNSIPPADRKRLDTMTIPLRHPDDQRACSWCGEELREPYLDWTDTTGHRAHVSPNDCASNVREQATMQHMATWGLAPVESDFCIDVVGTDWTPGMINVHLNLEACSGLPGEVFDHSRIYRVMPWSRVVKYVPQRTLVLISEPGTDVPKVEPEQVRNSHEVALVAHEYPSLMLYHPATSGESDTRLILWTSNHGVNA